MSPFVAEDRPSYVQFEYRSIEDRDASIAAGHYVGKDVAFVIITPGGNKDSVERIASEWFIKLQGDLDNNRIPPAWVQMYKDAFKAWESGQEAPLNGTALTNWPPVQPSMLKTLLELRIRTVEDLAVANDDTINALGMGGRALKQQAVNWLSSANEHGKLSSRMSALEVENSGLKQRIADLESRESSLVSELTTLRPAEVKPANQPPKLIRT
jgi:hypothetical protein